jgi:hypothetical protein
VFASTSDGQVLTVTTWDGVGPVVLARDQGEYASVSFTLVSQDGGRLQTWLGVPPSGEHDVLRWDVPATHTSLQVTLENLPPHDQYMVATCSSVEWGYHSLGAPLSVDFAGDTSDVYLRFGTAAGSFHGGWLDDVTAAGGDLTVDMSLPDALDELQQYSLDHIAAVDGDLVDWKASRAYPQGPAPWRVEVDRGELTGPPYVLEARLATLLAASEDLILELKTTSEDHWYRITMRGPWPTDLPDFSHEVTMLSTDVDGAVYEWDDQVDRHVARWNLGGGHPATWLVEGPPEDGPQIGLPRLPAEVTDAFPGLVREDFSIVELLLEVEVGETGTYESAWLLPVIVGSP